MIKWIFEYLKKQGRSTSSGSVTAKQLAGYSALLEDKKHKETTFYSSLGNIVSFYG